MADWKIWRRDGWRRMVAVHLPITKRGGRRRGPLAYVSCTRELCTAPVSSDRRQQTVDSLRRLRRRALYPAATAGEIEGGRPLSCSYPYLLCRSRGGQRASNTTRRDMAVTWRRRQRRRRQEISDCTIPDLLTCERCLRTAFTPLTRLFVPSCRREA